MVKPRRCRLRGSRFSVHPTDFDLDVWSLERAGFGIIEQDEVK